MAYKVILVPVDSNAGRRALRAAFGILQGTNGHIEAFHVRADSKEAVPLLGEGMSGSMIEEMIDLADKDGDERSRSAKAIFDTFVAETKVAVTDKISVSGSAPSASWRVEVGREDEKIANRGRVADLIVMAQPVGEVGRPSMMALHAAIFETARPVLMLPDVPPAKIGSTVVIAWNGTSEAARAVAGAMPFLESASKVVALTVETEKSVNRIDADELASYLGAHGINAERVTVEQGAKPVGETILEYCKSVNADLLVTGAFTHSRLIQIILGGVTRHLIGTAHLPVLMDH
jgi:nucleotide-binding universal stress UspA family protein